MSCRSRVRNQSSAIKFEDSSEISRLPNALWQSILFLPLEDAFTMSSVLNSWLRGWTNFPVLEFHFDNNDGDALEILVKSIDESLLGLRQARYLIEAKEALKYLLDVRSHSSDLEALELRRSECDPLSADEFVCHGRKEIVDEDRPRLGILLVPLPILLIAPHHMHL
ncbi:F-box/LRR-repeat protein [Senna tora]|uniref:F-box/LRR-repeat protein n=1 Tax=Senna tora TaxID=362788 RepID=A0A834W6U3_9FABA|nr:F-box/LRR-repeat protein [Senna tora]